MSNAKDIASAADVHVLIATFYAALLDDELLAPHFAHLDLPAHIPRIVAFWDMILFGTRGFTGDVMGTHMRLNTERPIPEAAMQRWLEHFTATVDAHFRGAKAEEAKERARNIGALMLVKMGNT